MSASMKNHADSHFFDFETMDNITGCWDKLVEKMKLFTKKNLYKQRPTAYIVLPVPNSA